MPSTCIPTSALVVSALPEDRVLFLLNPVLQSLILQFKDSYTTAIIMIMADADSLVDRVATACVLAARCHNILCLSYFDFLWHTPFLLKQYKYLNIFVSYPGADPGLRVRGVQELGY